MEVILDLRTEGYGESESREDLDHVVHELHHGVYPSPNPAPGRKGDVQAASSFFLGGLPIFKQFLSFREPGFKIISHRVHSLSSPGAFFRRKGSKVFQP